MGLGALLLLTFAVVFGGMLLLWLISIRTRDPSFIDACWGLGFVVVAWVAHGATKGDTARSLAIVLATTLWGLRLGGYLMWRWRKNGPDPRYQAMLRHAKGNPHLFTLKMVFLLQGTMMWVVSLPLQLGQRYAHPKGLTPWGIIGLVLCGVGIAFESVGDRQLVRFKADPANQSAVLDTGLWRYTRHPNYFGDACTWWGLFFISVVNPVTAIGVLGPVTMTVLLLKWSGVPTLERSMHKRRPGYADYIERTSSFIPRPPRRSVKGVGNEMAPPAV